AARAALAGERIARVLARADLPEGLVRIAHGRADVGVALATSQVAKILFTGSPAGGRGVARPPVAGEEGGGVGAWGQDAGLGVGVGGRGVGAGRLHRAAAGGLWAGCVGAGQARGCIERVYVAREMYERFLSEIVSRAAALTVGDPADPRTQVGPLASARRLEH